MSYNRKYYLHRQVRKYGIKLITKSKTINIASEQSIQAQENKYVNELSNKYSYSVQYINPLFAL